VGIAWRRQDEAFARKVSQGYDTLLRQTVVFWDGKNAAHHSKQLALDARIIERQHGNADIVRTCRDPIGHVMDIPDIDGNPGLWVPRDKRFRCGRQNSKRCYHQCHNTKMSTLEGANIARDIDDLIYRRQCALGFVKERSPVFSANQPLALSRKELEPEFFFQVADQTAHGRLRHVQTLRRRF